MGFLGGLFSKKGDPLAALRAQVEAKPNDPRLAMDLANQLKAQGDLTGAHEYALRAAQAHIAAGFNAKAVSVLKSAAAWGEPSTELLQALVDVLIDLKHKEDARGALSQLRRLHVSAGNTGELSRVDALLTELGPAR